MPLNKYSNIYIELVKQITLYGINVQNAVTEWFALDLFWDALQDNEEMTLENFYYVCNAYDYLLGYDLTRQKHNEVLGWIAENIKNNRSVPQSLQRALKIICMRNMYISLLDSNPNNQVINMVIKEWDESCNLVQLLIENITNFCNDVNDPTEKLFFFNARQALEERLQFFKAILTRSELIMDKDQIDVLWDSTVPVLGKSELCDNVLLFFRDIRSDPVYFRIKLIIV